MFVPLYLQMLSILGCQASGCRVLTSFKMIDILFLTRQIKNYSLCDKMEAKPGAGVLLSLSCPEAQFSTGAHELYSLPALQPHPESLWLAVPFEQS